MVHKTIKERVRSTSNTLPFNMMGDMGWEMDGRPRKTRSYSPL